MALASATAQHALSSHNDPISTITDVRMALSDCGVLIPLDDPAEQAWKERLRVPLTELAEPENGGRTRVTAEKRKREDEDTRDVREFTKWYDSTQFREIKRVAAPETTSAMLPAVGVGGSVVRSEDFLTMLKKKHSKTGDDTRLQGTALGRSADTKDLVVEGGPVQRIRDWRPRLKVDQRSTNIQAPIVASRDVALVTEVEGERTDKSMDETVAQEFTSAA